MLPRAEKLNRVVERRKDEAPERWLFERLHHILRGNGSVPFGGEREKRLLVTEGRVDTGG
jgi:hypothetical protein